ncbi:MAG: hypothetical protein KJO91_09205 [Gammaproteobacteria bacterium]|nr:hypothetical protein [Gammaproteobacteria bacterium]
MAQKKVWITWLPEGEDAPEPDATASALAQVGLEVSGARWVDDLEKVAWVELGGLLLEPNKADLWLIAGRQSDFESTRNRYGLSMASAMVADARQTPLPGVCIGLDFEPAVSDMPMLLRHFQCLNGAEPSWPAKVVAAAFGKAGESCCAEFRFNVIAHAMLGQWFEVGPSNGQWQGVMFGVDADGTITHHAVGPRAQLPEKAVLEYPTQGIKAALGETEFTAWSVQNVVGAEDSYYIKVEGFPNAVIIGAHPDSDDADVFHLELT